jgi:cbb3-type cytochrome oxidase maturation protein
MSIIFLLIPLSVLLATAFLCAFIWAVRSGQYEDTYTPSIRLLMRDPPAPGRPGVAKPARGFSKTTEMADGQAGKLAAPPPTQSERKRSVQNSIWLH